MIFFSVIFLLKPRAAGHCRFMLFLFGSGLCVKCDAASAEPPLSHTWPTDWPQLEVQAAALTQSKLTHGLSWNCGHEGESLHCSCTNQHQWNTCLFTARRLYMWFIYICDLYMWLIYVAYICDLYMLLIYVIYIFDLYMWLIYVIYICDIYVTYMCDSYMWLIYVIYTVYVTYICDLLYICHLYM